MKHTIFPSIPLRWIAGLRHADGCRYQPWHPPENEMSKRPPGIAVRRPLALWCRLLWSYHQFRHPVYRSGTAPSAADREVGR